MAISTSQNPREIALMIFADIQSALPELNPFQKENIIKSIGIAVAGRLFDIERKIPLLLQEFFLQTALNLTFIKYWGFLRNADLKAATYATGFIPIEGTVLSVIPLGTLLNTSDSIQYSVIGGDNYLVQSVTINIVNITSDGLAITIDTGVEHNYSINMTVTITGVINPLYNGTFTIAQIISNTQFTCTSSLSTTSDSTGNSTSVFANVEIKSSKTGYSSNLGLNAKLTLDAPIIGVSSDNYVPFNEIGNGADIETNEEYKLRVEDSWRNPFAFFNKSFVKQVILNTSGVTRAWIFSKTPAVGFVTNFFVRDNDPEGIFPNPTEIAEVKNRILAYKPIDRDDDNIVVLSPTPLPVDFTFTALSPNSQSMRDAIELSLKQFFLDDVNVGQEILIDDYRSAIKDTINPETGEKLISFSLSEPVSDITVSASKLPILGDINYS